MGDLANDAGEIQTSGLGSTRSGKRFEARSEVGLINAIVLLFDLFGINLTKDDVNC